MGQVLFYRGCKSLLFFSVLGLLFFSSCRSTRSFTSPLPEEYSIRMSKSSASGYKNVKRVRKYEFAHRDVPAAFDGCRLGFVSDLHYRSLLKEKGLRDITRLLNDLRLDALLIGGDLHEGCEYVPDVIAALGAVKTPLGTYGHNGQSPTLSLSPDDFVILLSHTPDYAEDVPVTNTDLVLAGHTHGGQVTLFGLYAPVIPSRYGQRFLTGLRYNSNNTPIIITNGIGTSRKNVRLFAPSEVVVITLRRFVNIEHTMHYE